MLFILTLGDFRYFNVGQGKIVSRKIVPVKNTKATIFDHINVQEPEVEGVCSTKKCNNLNGNAS